jgi:hypothetical protein
MPLVTRELIREALEIHEDIVLAKIAEKREKALIGRSNLTHDKVWE